MGIDAEMFVRLPTKDVPPERELKYLSYMLSSTIGPEYFFISKGQYGSKHHALSLLSNEHDDYKVEAYPEAEGRITWFQDGSPIYADPDESFIRVHLMSRYYGPGYERGNWMVLRTTIEWLKRHFPSGAIWYGGDSSGVCAEHMTEEKLREFDELFFRSGRQGYTHTTWRRDGDPTPICPTCEEPTMNIGGGGGQSFHACSGCNAQFIVSGIAVYESPSRHDTDIFKLAEDVRQGKLSPSFTLSEQTP